MNLHDLQDYNNWIGKTAHEIRKHVINAGGWTRVLPKGKPLDPKIHFVRQFFNEPPMALVRVKDSIADMAISNARRKQGSVTDKVASWGASSGDVYLEIRVGANGKNEMRYWIEQSQTGSRYHSKERRGLLASAILTHHFTGNFKMCWPDGTGGSSETALHNWMHGITGKIGKRNAANVGGHVNARTQAIISDKYRGSYNFADTMDAGYAEHKRLDVEPDEKYGQKYVIEGRWTPAHKRVFLAEHFA